MALIDRETDQLLYQNALENFAEALGSNDYDHVIFLGAGASIDDEQSDLPDARTLSKELADKLGIDWHETIPLSRIAFYYEALRGRNGLNKFLRDKLSRKHSPDGPPAPTARTLEYLVEILEIVKQKGKSSLVITTNYDELFEIAYENKYHRTPEVVVYRGGFESSDIDQSLLHHQRSTENVKSWSPGNAISLFKMHGCISDADAHHLVITDEDYINFISNAWNQSEKKRLPWHVEGLFNRSNILFVGYSLEDWNFRILYKQSGEKNDRDKLAVQFLKPLDPREKIAHAKRRAMVEFWGTKRVNIVNAKADDFMSDLLDLMRR